VVRLLRGLRWYLREITGDAAYDRYRAWHARHHPRKPVPSRREYERLRFSLREHETGGRCC
jgi:uncharacterized short protein YbdD (DUF466 family)